MYALLLANIIDLDHIYYRIAGKVSWFSSACPEIGMNCGLNFYPMHTLIVMFFYLGISGPLFLSAVAIISKRNIPKLLKNPKIHFIGWLGVGILIHILLDYLHLKTGFFI
jgi:hypothetical protein